MVFRHEGDRSKGRARTTPTRRRLRLLIGVVAGLAAYGAFVVFGGPPRWLIDELATRYPGCVYRVPARAPVVALTLDDGPDSVTTPLILDELERHGARATFFLISTRAAHRDQLIRRLVAGGHEIGNHFTLDRPSIGLDPDAFARDLRQADEVLARYGPLRWARPGSGRYSHTMIATMSNAGYRCALGSVYPYDATIPSAGFAAWHIRRNVSPGGIIVLHDGGARGMRTVRVLKDVLPWLRHQGYRVVTLSELAPPT